MALHQHNPLVRRRRLPAGFTLVELVMVSAIIVVLALIAVPRFTNATQRYRADAAARRVVADIDMARKEAIATSSTRTFSVDTATVSYAIPDAAGFDPGQATYQVYLKMDPYRVTAFSASFANTFTGEVETQFTFDGFGTCDSNGSIDVYVGSEKRTILLDQSSGQARIQ